MRQQTRALLVFVVFVVTMCAVLATAADQSTWDTTTTTAVAPIEDDATLPLFSADEVDMAYEIAPGLGNDAMSTKDSTALQLVRTAIAAVAELAGIVPTFDMPTDTSVRIGIRTIRKVDVTDMVDKVNALLAFISANFTVTSITSAVLNTVNPVPVRNAVTKLALDTLLDLFKTLPNGFQAQTDIFLRDFRCDAKTGASCSVPATVGGVRLANVILKTPSWWTNLLIAPVKAVSVPLLNAMMPTILDPVLTRDVATNRFTFLVPKGGEAVNATLLSALRADATPLSDVGMVRAVVNAANALGGIGALKLHLSTYTNTTLLVNANISERVDLVKLLTSESATLLMGIGEKYLPVIGELQPVVESLDTVSWVDAMNTVERIARGTNTQTPSSVVDSNAAHDGAKGVDDADDSSSTSAHATVSRAKPTTSPAEKKSFGEALADVLDLISFTDEKMRDLLRLIGNSVGGTILNVAVSLDDLECRNGGYSCSFPTFLGLRVADLTANGVSLVDAVLAPMLPATRSVVNEKIDPLLASMPLYCRNATDGRCHITLKNEKAVKVPHFSFLIAFPILAVIVIVAIVAQNVVRRTHRITRLLPSAKDECYTSTGEPISVAHIVIEDTIVCVVAMLLLACFVITHFTTIAYIIVGGEWTMYLFALHTVSHLWKCGLQAESTFIIVFSGALVYLKLVVLIVFAVVLHRPRCLVMRIFDVIGGFSMVLTYVLLCFYSFMETPGMIEVRMRPSFYLFVAGVFGSFLLGHYLVYFWRFGTNIRDKPFSLSDFTEDADENARTLLVGSSNPLDGAMMSDSKSSLRRFSLGGNISVYSFDASTAEFKSTLGVEDRSADQNLDKGTQPAFTQQLVHWVCEFFRHGVWWPVSIPLFVVIGVTILPGWMAVSITYRVGGVASVAINNVRSFTLMDQSTALGSAVAAGLVMTGAVMPLVYCLFYNGIPSAAGWCTAFTVFMTSCAGLIHINRFVQYVLAGEAGGMDDFYNGHATIEWPLWLQCVPGVLVYVAVVCDFLGVRRRLSAYCLCGRESTRQRAKAESYPVS